jgi:predicted transcriptional regulator
VYRLCTHLVRDNIQVSPKKPFHIRLSDDYLRKLEKLAKREEVSMAHLVRIALNRLFEAEKIR